MTQENFADLVLILHFGIVIFIISLFVIIPVGYRFKWNWPRNRKLRTTHLFFNLSRHNRNSFWPYMSIDIN